MTVLKQDADGTYRFWCPGCEEYHSFDKRWTFDGNMEAPTFNPSLKVGPYWMVPRDWNWKTAPRDEDGKYKTDAEGRLLGAVEMLCHSFVRSGQIQFLPDCKHKLAGKTVPMVDMEALAK